MGSRKYTKAIFNSSVCKWFIKSIIYTLQNVLHHLPLLFRLRATVSKQISWQTPKGRACVFRPIFDLNLSWKQIDAKRTPSGSACRHFLLDLCGMPMPQMAKWYVLPFQDSWVRRRWPEKRAGCTFGCIMSGSNKSIAFVGYLHTHRRRRHLWVWSNIYQN